MMGNCVFAIGLMDDVVLWLTNAVNALSIIIPCHRVIGSDGSLTGYGGGVDRKRFLLDFEKKDF